MELYYTFSVLIVLASLFAYLNVRFLKLLGTIGIMIIAMLVSVGIRLVGDQFFPRTTQEFFELIREFDFTEILMGAMLNFLLFAGALHVNISDLREHKWPIFTYATIRSNNTLYLLFTFWNIDFTNRSHCSFGNFKRS